MIAWLMRWWRARQRQIDLDILWPVCVEQAGDNLDLAKAAFATHAFHDRAWLADFTPGELADYIDHLEPVSR